MDEFQKALEDQMRHLSSKYCFPNPPDSVGLQLQYGKYVGSDALENLMQARELSAADAAELRIRNAEAALGARLVCLDGALQEPFLEDHHGFHASAEASVIRRLAGIDSVASMRRLIEARNLQLVDLARELEVSRPGMNSFLRGVPLRRKTFVRLCEVLEATGDEPAMAYLHFLWAQMYSEGRLLDGLLSGRKARHSCPTEQEHLFGLLSYWTRNFDYLQKMSRTRH